MVKVDKIKQISDYLRRFEPEKEETKLAFSVFENLRGKEEQPRVNRVLEISLIAIEYLNVYTSTLIGIVAAEFPEMQKDIPEKIMEIAAGYHRIRQYHLTKENINKEDYLTFILTAAGDMRSVLVAIAANLYELKESTLREDDRQESIRAAELIYSPLCHRLGFYRLKSVIDDSVISHKNPDAYKMVLNKLQETAVEREALIARFIKPIDDELRKHKIKYRIKSRTKAVSSIYAKMLKQDIPFGKVYDVFAIRIITDSKPATEKADCWHVYSVVTNIYKPQIERLRDWISKPRDNGYESLHITVETPEHKFVEVQIRSERMDDEAENGMAAHWRYKGGKGGSIDYYLQRIRKAIERKSFISDDDSLSSTGSLGELFAFTPTGELKKFKQGATVLDFAFSIHSEVGVRCKGARINGKIKSIKESLKNGDMVEIITSGKQKPTLDWLNYVKSNKAKSRIRKALDEEKRLEAEQGKEILLRRLKNWKIDFSQELPEKLSKSFGAESVTEFYRGVFLEKYSLAAIKKLLKSEEKNISQLTDEEVIRPEEKRVNRNDVLVIDELDNLNYRLAHCCNPVPGDKVFGFVTVSRGITIHREQCSNAASMKERYPYRIIPARWRKKEEKTNFRAEIFIKGVDREGVLGDITKLISNTGSLISINMKTVGRHFRGSVVVKVFDASHLKHLLEKLHGQPDLLEVYRKR